MSPCLTAVPAAPQPLSILLQHHRVRVIQVVSGKSGLEVMRHAGSEALLAVLMHKITRAAHAQVRCALPGCDGGPDAVCCSCACLSMPWLAISRFKCVDVFASTCAGLGAVLGIIAGPEIVLVRPWFPHDASAATRTEPPHWHPS